MNSIQTSKTIDLDGHDRLKYQECHFQWLKTNYSFMFDGLVRQQVHF